MTTTSPLSTDIEHDVAFRLNSAATRLESAAKLLDSAILGPSMRSDSLRAQAKALRGEAARMDGHIWQMFPALSILATEAAR